MKDVNLIDIMERHLPFCVHLSWQVWPLFYDELIRQRMAARVLAKAPGYSQDVAEFEIDRTALEKTVVLFRERGSKGDGKAGST